MAEEEGVPENRDEEAGGPGAGKEREGADPPPPKASADEPAPSTSSGGTRIQPNKNREIQAARTGGRKLFDEAAQAVFLEWFAATCNVSWSAEKAGFNYKTVLRHRMEDERFAEGWRRAVAQGYARLEAKQLETKRTQPKIGIEGDWDAPEMDDIDPQLRLHILREHRREFAGVRKQGRRPRVATNAEVREALAKGLRAFRDRVRARMAGRKGPADGEDSFPGESRGPADEGPAGELDPGLRRGTGAGEEN